jgi:predicted nucleic acid-binding Zn ribbon protein
MYHNTRKTNKHIAEVLPKVLDSIAKVHGERPDLILLAWPQIIGEKMAPMTKAVSFTDGVLTVRVNNSTLLSILTQHEKKRLLQQLREKFPSVPIRDLLFRLG